MMGDFTENINYSISHGMEKHNKFVEEYKKINGGSIDGFYKVYCIENDMDENKEVEKWWNEHNPNVNNLYEFHHLTGLKYREEELFALLGEDAITDIIAQVNILDTNQFERMVVPIAKSMRNGTKCQYLKSMVFHVFDGQRFINDIKEICDNNDTLKQHFNILCKDIDIVIIEKFNNQLILSGI